MAFDPTPWAIAGGAVHSAETARMLAYIATGGHEGVGDALALRVRAQDTPVGSIVVGPGAYSINNSYAGQADQAYAGRAPSDTVVTVAPTSGSPRSDMIVARIDDPQYGGSAPLPGGPFAKPFLISNVGSAKTAAELGLSYPAIELARIDIPASTSAITNAMITDLRKLVKAEYAIDVIQYAVPSALQLTTTAASPGQIWPKATGFDIDIPAWATKMIIIADISGLKTTDAGNGWVWLRKGTNADVINAVGPQYRYDTAAGDLRWSQKVSAEFDIEPSERGTTKNFSIRGYVTTGTGTARPTADSGSDVILDVRFIEAPTDA